MPRHIKRSKVFGVSCVHAGPLKLNYLCSAYMDMHMYTDMYM